MSAPLATPASTSVAATAPSTSALSDSQVELIHNTALGVVRNGSQFADWLKSKRSGDPQYAFLSASGQGAEYFEWCVANPESTRKLVAEAEANREDSDSESESDDNSEGSSDENNSDRGRARRGRRGRRKRSRSMASSSRNSSSSGSSHERRRRSRRGRSSSSVSRSRRRRRHRRRSSSKRRRETSEERKRREFVARKREERAREEEKRKAILEKERRSSTQNKPRKRTMLRSTSSMRKRSDIKRKAEEAWSKEQRVRRSFSRIRASSKRNFYHGSSNYRSFEYELPTQDDLFRNSGKKWYQEEPQQIRRRSARDEYAHRRYDVRDDEIMRREPNKVRDIDERAERNRYERSDREEAGSGERRVEGDGNATFEDCRDKQTNNPTANTYEKDRPMAGWTDQRDKNKRGDTNASSFKYDSITEKKSKMYGWSDDEVETGQDGRSQNVVPSRERVNQGKELWYKDARGEWRKSQQSLTTKPQTVRIDGMGQNMENRSDEARLSMLKDKLLKAGADSWQKKSHEASPESRPNQTDTSLNI